MNTARIHIAVDAMGGDHAPREVVAGSVLGARKYNVGLKLVGIPEMIQAELDRLSSEGTDLRGLDIEIVEATEIIDMDESPATALRKKKNASVIVAAKLVGEKKAQGLIAAGSTGAAMAAALFNIGRIDGVDRPAIAVTMPSMNKPCLLLDGGANADCIPEMLVQFARMGSIFMQGVYNIDRPSVGLLNIGGEAGKGNTFVNSAFKLLENDHTLNFIGNAEGRDIFLGDVDVVVCDGFTGNVALKSAEGAIIMMTTLLKNELTKDLPSKAVGLLVKPAFSRAKSKMDPDEFGGALLLGLKGICVIAHGGSKAYAIQSCVRVAKNAVEGDVLNKISSKIKEGCAAV